MFIGRPESISEEDTRGSNTTYLKKLDNDKKYPLIVFELILTGKVRILRIYVDFILNYGMKSVLVVIIICVEGQQVHVDSKFMVTRIDKLKQCHVL